ncbi:MAG: hypothetical protein M3P85_12030 [Actinomycetota bacterium]|nr:hypothetical protein [Actinomycetota bacterium]
MELERPKPKKRHPCISDSPGPLASLGPWPEQRDPGGAGAHLDLSAMVLAGSGGIDIRPPAFAGRADPR